MGKEKSRSSSTLTTRETDIKKLRAKLGTFVKAMKRIGCEDNRTMWRKLNNFTGNQILEEMNKIADEDNVPKCWKINDITYLVMFYELGTRIPDAYCDDFPEKVNAAIHALGHGDLFSDSVTPEAILDVLDVDATVKECIPLSVIRSYLGYSRDKETLRRTHPALLAAYTVKTGDAALGCSRKPPSTPEEEEHCRLREEVRLEDLDLPFVREQKELRFRVQRDSNRRNRLFLRCLNKLGGDANVVKITPEALFDVILQESDPLDIEDSLWTLERVSRMLSKYRDGVHPYWSPIHHNKMLEAIQFLGGDAFNENLVTPSAVLDFINDAADHADCDVTNIHAVKPHLESLRAALKEDPHHPLSYPRRITSKFQFRFIDEEPSFVPCEFI